MRNGHKFNKLDDLIEKNKGYLLDLAKKLVEIPSHKEVKGQEKEIANYLVNELHKQNLEAHLQEVENGRSNVICKLEGTGGGRSLILNGHLDTVPPMGMDKPFQPEVKDGKLYGRGSVDMKGPLASMFYSLIILNNSDITLGGDLIVTGAIDEETLGKGSAYIAKNGPYADAAIVGEPTELKVVVTHKGFQGIEVEVKGKASHGSAPQNGINAVLKGIKIVRALEEELKPTLNERNHDLLGKPTINIGVFKGGHIPSVVPDKCIIQIDRRFIPGESVESLIAEFREVLDDLRAQDSELTAELRKNDDPGGFSNPPLDTQKNSFIVSKLTEAISEITDEKAEIGGMDGWTDASSLSNIAGIPSIVFGPGDRKQAHTTNEFIDVDELLLSSKLYLLTALKVCNSRVNGKRVTLETGE